VRKKEFQNGLYKKFNKNSSLCDAIWFIRGIISKVICFFLHLTLIGFAYNKNLRCHMAINNGGIFLTINALLIISL